LKLKSANEAGKKVGAFACEATAAIYANAALRRFIPCRPYEMIISGHRFNNEPSHRARQSQ
jgi:hypothetical protein